MSANPYPCLDAFIPTSSLPDFRDDEHLLVISFLSCFLQRLHHLELLATRLVGIRTAYAGGHETAPLVEKLRIAVVLVSLEPHRGVPLLARPVLRGGAQRVGDPVPACLRTDVDGDHDRPAVVVH